MVSRTRPGSMRILPLWIAVAAALTGMAAAPRDTCAQSLQVCFVSNGGPAITYRPELSGVDPVEAAVRWLVAGPNPQESASGLTTWIPPSTTIVGVSVATARVEVDLSPEILIGLGDATLEGIYDQFRVTLLNRRTRSIRLTCAGQLLSAYLPPSAPVPPAVQTLTAGIATAVGLSGKSVTIGPSHGRYWNGSAWNWQRSDPCGLGEAVLEDTNSIRLCQLLRQYLVQDGATVYVPRTLDESVCCHSETGLPWWKLCAQTWLHSLGLPCSVWGNASGNCGADSAIKRYDDDIRARPLYADYCGSTIYIAHHTNAGGGTGTETYHDTAMEHPAHESNSLALANAVNAGVVNAIRELYDNSWADRGVQDSSGGFGEIRIPNRPACLIELAFHDRCDKDAAYLTDNYFRSVAEWGLYKGVCTYFSVTPTWDRYSDEIVSDTIPANMTIRQKIQATVTVRNRGVVWSTTRAFRLGAVDDSDPFSTSIRSDIVGEVFPGQTTVLTLDLTAPALPGTYTTDWRMVRDGVTWFGPILSRSVVVRRATIPGDMDGDSDVDMEDFGAVQNCLTGPGVLQSDPACTLALMDADNDVDQTDLVLFLNCLTGAGIQADLDCTSVP